MKTFLGIALLLSSCQFAEAAEWHDLMKYTVRLTNEDDNSVGSGVVIFSSRKGVQVLTAQHVVEDDDDIYMEWFTRKSYPRPAGRAKVENLGAGVSFGNGDYATVAVWSKKAGKALRSMDFADELPSGEFGAWYCGCAKGNEPTAHSCNVIGERKTGRKLELVVDKEPKKGTSGGPLAIRNGGRWKLIGLCSTGFRGTGGFVHFSEIDGLNPSRSDEEVYKEAAELAQEILQDLRSLRQKKAAKKGEPPGRRMRSKRKGMAYRESAKRAPKASDGPKEKPAPKVSKDLDGTERNKKGREIMITVKVEA